MAFGISNISYWHTEHFYMAPNTGRQNPMLSRGCEDLFRIAQWANLFEIITPSVESSYFFPQGMLGFQK